METRLNPASGTEEGILNDAETISALSYLALSKRARGAKGAAEDMKLSPGPCQVMIASREAPRGQDGLKVDVGR